MVMIYTGDVIVDVREPAHVRRAANEMFPNVNVQMIDTGDIIAPGVGVGIERKTVPDFVSSIYDGRLFKQAGRLNDSFPSPYIVVIGDPDLLEYNEHINFNPLDVYSTMGALNARFNVRCILLPNERAAWHFINKVFCDSMKEPIDLRCLEVSKNPGNTMIGIIAQIPGVGPKTAAKIYDHFKPKKVSDLCRLSEKDFCEVDGIGRKTSKNIKKFLR